MAKVDNNGVKHSGWASVGKANRGEMSDREQKEYRSNADSQGVKLYNSSSGKLTSRKPCPY